MRLWRTAHRRTVWRVDCSAEAVAPSRGGGVVPPVGTPTAGLSRWWRLGLPRNRLRPRRCGNACVCALGAVDAEGGESDGRDHVTCCVARIERGGGVPPPSPLSIPAVSASQAGRRVGQEWRAVGGYQVSRGVPLRDGRRSGRGLWAHKENKSWVEAPPAARGTAHSRALSQHNYSFLHSHLYTTPPSPAPHPPSLITSRLGCKKRF